MKLNIEHTIKKALINALGTMLLFLAIATAICVVLSPGIIINNIRGRYNDSKGPVRIWPAVKDWQTWVISLPVAAAVWMFLSPPGVFGTTPASAPKQWVPVTQAR